MAKAKNEFLSLVAEPGVFLAAMVVAAGVAQVARAADYVLDNGIPEETANASTGTEARDNWFGNRFTAEAGGNLITQVVFGVVPSETALSASVVLYRVTNSFGMVQGSARVYTQPFTPVVGADTNFTLQVIELLRPVHFQPGERFVVAVFIPNVPAAPPNDAHPFIFDTGPKNEGSYWDRAAPGTFNLDDLRQARSVGQGFEIGSFVYGRGHLILRASGVALDRPTLNSVLRAGDLELWFATQKGVQYQLSSSTNLAGLNAIWTNEGSSLTGTGETIRMMLPLSAAGAKFFRAQVQ